MKIIYIHQYFVTPAEPGGTRSYWFAKELINSGHEVTMITSTNTSHPLPGRFNIDGINVIYVKNDYSNYFSPFRKIISFLKFFIKSILKASKEKQVDLVFATSTPLTVGAIALWLKRLKHWNYVFEVRDLWPEFPIQIGAIKNRLLIRILKRLEKNIYKNAEHIIALSPGMQNGILNCEIPKNKVSMIPNMSKPDIFYPRKISEKIAKDFLIDTSKFNVIHFGSMGVANGLTYIIETAKYLKTVGNEDIRFIFLGDGATQPTLKQLVNEYNLSSVCFLGNHEMSLTSEIVNCCDLSVVSFLNIPILYTNSPNKLFDSLSAGKPLVVNSAGWTKDLVEKNECGFYVNPNDPQDFADKLLKYKEEKILLKKWGENARSLSISSFDKSILTKRFVDIINSVLKQV